MPRRTGKGKGGLRALVGGGGARRLTCFFVRPPLPLRPTTRVDPERQLYRPLTPPNHLTIATTHSRAGPTRYVVDSTMIQHIHTQYAGATHTRVPPDRRDAKVVYTNERRRSHVAHCIGGRHLISSPSPPTPRTSDASSSEGDAGSCESGESVPGAHILWGVWLILGAASILASASVCTTILPLGRPS